MKLHLILVISILHSTFGDPPPEPPPEPEPEPEVEEGIPVEESVPCYCRVWILRADGTRDFCDGTLVARNQVLTSAHCLEDCARYVTCCGSEKCFEQEGACYHSKGTEGIFVHRGYLKAAFEGKYYDNLAYIKIEDRSFVSQSSSTCEILEDPEKTENMEGKVLISATCARDETGKFPEKLQKIQTKIQNAAECIEEWKNKGMEITHEYYLNFTKTLRPGNCTETPGAGLYVKDEKLKLGMTNSFGSCSKGYTLSKYYTNFIKKGEAAINYIEYSKILKAIKISHFYRTLKDFVAALKDEKERWKADQSAKFDAIFGKKNKTKEEVIDSGEEVETTKRPSKKEDKKDFIDHKKQFIWDVIWAPWNYVKNKKSAIFAFLKSPFDDEAPKLCSCKC